MERVILHCDMNNFYASVESLHRPELRDKPIAVCGDSEARHGIVLAKNYIAKKFGIKTGDVIWEAKKKCKDLITVTANFPLYLKFSKMARKIYERYTDKIESFGIDECWLDCTGCKTTGEELANEIREVIKFELGCTASVGVSWNKIFAKLGSDMKKPDATTVINKKNYKDMIFNLPVEDLLYVGRATKSKLNKFNIITIGDLAQLDLKFLKRELGKWGEYLWTFANGYDTSPVETKDCVKSIGNSTTAVRDLKNETDVKTIVTILAESIASRLREQGLKGQVISLYIRSKDLKNWNKQKKIYKPTYISSEIINNAMDIFKDYTFINPIRSIGLSISTLTSEDSAYQLDLFNDEKKTQKRETLEKTIDNLRNRFGHFSINRAIEYIDKSLSNFNPKQENVIHPYNYF